VLDRLVPFSKFDPLRPVEKASEGTTASATRRAKILRWANWIVAVYTALGFGLIVYWLMQAN
jgi:hypothetical protein